MRRSQASSGQRCVGSGAVETFLVIVGILVKGWRNLVHVPESIVEGSSFFQRGCVEQGDHQF